MISPKEILLKHHFRITSHRVELLKYFMASSRAITHQELEAHFDGKMDRVSIYRILNSFNEGKLLHKLIDSKGKISYVFDKHSIDNKGNSNNNPPHFKCISCDDVVELPNLPKSYLDKLSTDHNVEFINLIAEGTCNKCKTKSE